MMTTMAALLAGLPLMLGSGTGSELRQPLGYAMVGGLILSQALTLYTTPGGVHCISGSIAGCRDTHQNAQLTRPCRSAAPLNDGYALAPDLKRSAARARAFAASVSRSRGGALLTSDVTARAPPGTPRSTARVNAASFASDGRVQPLSLRTNCRAEA